MTTGPSSTIISALERTWAEMRDKHTDLPEVVFITGIGTSKMAVKWGHWHPDRWQEYGAQTNRLPEVFISGECLAQGPVKVLQTLLHEGAHALAHVRGIKDTSRGHRYHNSRFVHLANELGLDGPEVADEVRGWSACVIRPETENDYESFDLLADAITVVIGGKLETGPAVAPPPKERKPQPKYGCGCERIVRVSKAMFEMGPIVCGLCDTSFEEVLG